MDATQIILIVLIVALIVIYPIMMYSRNKKPRQQMQEQTNSLKRGDRVLTASGVYGTIVDLHLDGDKTIVTIETGTEKNRGYISVDAYAIYSIIKEEENLTEVASTEFQEKSPVIAEAKAEESEVKEPETIAEENSAKSNVRKPRTKNK